MDKFVLKCTLFQWKRLPYWFGIFCTAKLSIKSKKSQEEKTSKQKQNSHPFLEIKAINSVFLLEIAGIRIDYCTPLKKKYARSKNKIETDFFNIQIKKIFPSQNNYYCQVYENAPSSRSLTNIQLVRNYKSLYSGALLKYL